MIFFPFFWGGGGNGVNGAFWGSKSILKTFSRSHQNKIDKIQIALRIVHKKYNSSLHDLIELDKTTTIRFTNIGTPMTDMQSNQEGESIHK